MVDFTRTTSGMSREEIVELLQWYEHLAFPVFEMCSGEVIKSVGDAYLVLFDSPTNAVLAGVHLQETFREESKERGRPILIRIGISSGEVILEKNDVFGEPVNLASRILSITPPDEVYFSESVYLSMNRNEIQCQEVGTFDLKGISSSTRIFKPVADASPPLQAPAQLQNPPTSNLQARALQGQAAPEPKEFPPVILLASGFALVCIIMYVLGLPGHQLAILALIFGVNLLLFHAHERDRERAERAGLNRSWEKKHFYLYPTTGLLTVFLVMWVMGTAPRHLAALGTMLLLILIQGILTLKRRLPPPPGG